MNKTQKLLFGALTRKRKGSAMKLYNAIKKEGYKKSYQNVVKTLKIMVKDKILEKDDLTYEISINWLNNRIKHLKKIKESVRASKIDRVYSDDNIEVFETDCLFELNEFWLQKVKDEYYEKDCEFVYWEGPNCWWLYTHLAEETQYLSELKSRGIDVYFLIKQRNKLNEKAYNFYDIRECNVAFDNSNKNVHLHRGLVGEKIIETRYHEKVNEFFDKLYMQDADFVSEIDKIRAFSYTNQIKITHDKALVDAYFKERVKQFRK